MDILQDYKFCKLTNEERWIFLGLTLLAVKNDNKIPYDEQYISQKISFSEISLTEIIKKLKDLKLIAIKSLSKCYQDDCLDKIRKEEIRKDDFSFPYKDAKEIVKEKMGGLNEKSL